MFSDDMLSFLLSPYLSLSLSLIPLFSFLNRFSLLLKHTHKHTDTLTLSLSLSLSPSLTILFWAPLVQFKINWKRRKLFIYLFIY